MKNQNTNVKLLKKNLITPTLCLESLSPGDYFRIFDDLDGDIYLYTNYTMPDDEDKVLAVSVNDGICQALETYTSVIPMESITVTYQEKYNDPI